MNADARGWETLPEASPRAFISVAGNSAGDLATSLMDLRSCRGQSVRAAGLPGDHLPIFRADARQGKPVGNRFFEQVPSRKLR